MSLKRPDFGIQIVTNLQKHYQVILTWSSISPVRGPALQGPGRFGGLNPLLYRPCPVSFRPKCHLYLLYLALPIYSGITFSDTSLGFRIFLIQQNTFDLDRTLIVYKRIRILSPNGQRFVLGYLLSIYLNYTQVKRTISIGINSNPIGLVTFTASFKFLTPLGY